MYYLIGISLILVAFFILNLLLSITAVIFWRGFSSYTARWTAASRADAIFFLRIFPSAIAGIFISAFLFPAYLRYEPAASNEIISLKLIFLALISLAAFGAAFYHLFASWNLTRRLLRNQIRTAEKLKLAGVAIPVYCVKHPFPLVAVCGAYRPQMLIAEIVFTELSAGELSAALAHEKGHIAAHDNLKRLLIDFCHRLTLFPVGISLNRQWAENAEVAADEYVLRLGGRSMRLDLASALIKLARLVPAHDIKPAMPVGAFLIEESIGDVTGRVRHLLQLDENIFDHRNRSRQLWLSLLVPCGLLIFLAFNENLLRPLFLVLEGFFSLLQ